MLDFLKGKSCRWLGAGILLGSYGIRILTSKDAKKAYTHGTAAVLRMKDEVVKDAFNQYFSGGFTGLILDEIRTKRSMAYSTYGLMSSAALAGKPTAFVGYIGSQSDKVVEAVKTFIHLTDSMPMHPERIEAVRTMIRQELQTSQPSISTFSANRMT